MSQESPPTHTSAPPSGCAPSNGGEQSRGPTGIPPKARVAAGLALAVYVLTHPILCWNWLSDPVQVKRFRFIEYAAALSLVSVCAGLIRSITLGVYVPIYGQWRMPLFDGLSYYLILGGWMVSVVLASAWILRKLVRAFSGEIDDSLALGVAFFSLTPFLLSGLLTLVPFELLRSLLSLSVFYCLYLLAQGTQNLNLVPVGHRLNFCLGVIVSTYLYARVSLGVCMAIFMPAYPALAPSSPPVSADVIEFQRNLEDLANAFSRG
jgi:hypothetical protein